MRLINYSVLAAALIAGSTLSAVAGAAEYKVMQKGKKFSPSTLNIKVGDTVVFIIDDKNRHNVYSRTDGHKFNIRKQKPGDASGRTFDKPGKIAIKCAIHPKMRLTINVK